MVVSRKIIILKTKTLTELRSRLEKQTSLMSFIGGIFCQGSVALGQQWLRLLPIVVM